MAATDVANITSRFTRKPYLTQEVIYGAGEPITPAEYVGIGEPPDSCSPIVEVINYTLFRRCSGVSWVEMQVGISLILHLRFRYTSALRSAFLGGGISSLENLDSNGKLTMPMSQNLVLTCIMSQVGFLGRQPMYS